MKCSFRLAALLALPATVLAVGPGVAAAAGHASALDAHYLRASIEGDRFEIQGGKAALHKSSNPAVRRLARRLVSDHTTSLHESVKLARRLGVEVPTKPSPSEQWELRAAGEETGAYFDHTYSDLGVQDHKQDIEDAKEEADKGSNAKVRKSARQEIPELEQHLALARRARRAS